MHNVNVEAVERTAAKAMSEPSAVVQHVAFAGEWQTEPGRPQFRATIPVPNGEPVTFEADFPPPMGGAGAAPNPLAYCFWGGLACYAMTYAQEAARRGIADADADPNALAELKSAADEHCPGAYCIRNPIDLRTHISLA